MLCGRYLNLARLTLTVFMILPTLVLLLFADEILITFFKQNSKVSEIAIQYCIISLPGMWALTQYDATKRYLNALQFGKLPVLTQIITSCVQVATCYIFIIILQWGILGAAIATNFAFILNMIFQDLWISLNDEDQFKDLWINWARTSGEGLTVYLEFALPSAVQECSLWWCL